MTNTITDNSIHYGQSSHSGRYIMLTGKKDLSGSTKYNYKRLSDIKHVINYIAREFNHSDSDDCICYGAINANARVVSETIHDFESTHAYTKPCKNYRYIYHEVYYFPDDILPYIEQNKEILVELSEKLAKKIAADDDNAHHYQVAYAVHEKKELELTHVHFAVNSVDICSYKKRRLYFSDLDKLDQILTQTVRNYIHKI